MNVREAVEKRIISLCKEKNLTINGLAYESGLPSSTLKSIIYGDSKNPGVVTLKVLCDGLDMTLAEFFDSDEFNELEQEIK
jgi:transcriptional regulator with XRE-family HTH domain